MRSLRPDTDSRAGITGPQPAGFLIQIDGSSLGNPGPAGIGVRILSADRSVVKEIRDRKSTRLNYQAEYEGLLCALEELRELGPTPAVIRTDSELLYYQMQGRYKVKNAGLKELNARARELKSMLPHVSIGLVRREQNKETDKLAKAAAQTADHRRHARE